MRHRVSGPEKQLVPFYYRFYQPRSVKQLVAHAKESARHDRKPVLVAVGMNGFVFGGVDPTDSYFEDNPIKSRHWEPCRGGEPPAAELITGFPISSTDEGTLVIPMSRSIKFDSVSLMLEQWAGTNRSRTMASQSVSLGTLRPTPNLSVAEICGRYPVRGYR
jgi:hypothetical protein